MGALGSTTNCRMMKLLVVAIALIAAASALPSPDAIAPEITLTQTMSEAARAAKATVTKMLETGSSDSACSELADTLISQVEEDVKAAQETLDAFKAPNDGTSCLDEGKAEVVAAEEALASGKKAAEDAAAASAAAAGASVDFGPVALSAMTDSSTGGLCGPWASDPAYTSAKAAAEAGASDAAEKAAAISGLEEALSSAKDAAAAAVKECECKVFTDYTAAFDAATTAAEGHESAYTKGKHMQCVLAGTAPDACDVGTVPTVTPITLAPGATACAPEAPTPTDCALGYTEKPGDVGGWGSINGKGGGQSVADTDACAALCSSEPTCNAYEFSQTELKCNLNTESTPTGGAYKDYHYCVTDEPVEHYGEDCWSGCSATQGKCDWCGSGGICCRKGWDDHSNGCDGILGMAGKGHVCVRADQGPKITCSLTIDNTLVSVKYNGAPVAIDGDKGNWNADKHISFHATEGGDLEVIGNDSESGDTGHCATAGFAIQCSGDDPFWGSFNSGSSAISAAGGSADGSSFGAYGTPCDSASGFYLPSNHGLKKIWASGTNRFAKFQMGPYHES